MVPTARAVALLMNSTNPIAERSWRIRPGRGLTALRMGTVLPASTPDSAIYTLREPWDQQTSPSPRPQPALQDSRQAVGEGPRVGRAFSVEDARFVEQEVHCVVLEGTGVRAQFRDRDDELVAWVHFKDRLRGRGYAPSAGEQALEPSQSSKGAATTTIPIVFGFGAAPSRPRLRFSSSSEVARGSCMTALTRHDLIRSGCRLADVAAGQRV